MELLPLLALIWRRRLAIAVGFALAIAAGVAIGGPPASASALAWTRVALDTPASQLVESAPSGYDSLPWRASLMSHLMLSDETRRELAHRLHVPADEVAVIDSAFATPEVPDMVALKASDAAIPAGALYVVTVSVPNVLLPAVSIQAVAPARDTATRLARAAVGVLESRASRAGTYSSMIRTNGRLSAKLQPFLVEQIAPVRLQEIVAHALPANAIAAAIFILGAWLGAVSLVLRLRRRLRVAPA